MSDPGRTVVIVGATGTQGGPVARALLRSGYDVRAATRDSAGPAGRELAVLGAVPVRVDLGDPDTLVAAADGASRAFLHLPMTLAGPGGGDVERAALDALRRAGVDHIALNTGMALPERPVGDPMLDGRIAFATALAGELRCPLRADAVNAWVTNEDVGACVVAAFHRADAYAPDGSASLDRKLTLPDVADRLARALGQPVRFQQISGAPYGEMMVPYLRETLAAAVGAGHDRMPAARNPLLTPDTTSTREALGMTFMSVEDWARGLDWQRAARKAAHR